jgi:Protein of unknown function (DUF2630)
MDDSQVLDRIDDLGAEAALRARGHGDLEPGDHAQPEQIKVSLDRCWDLLRQRRAKRDYGPRPG